MERKLKVIVIDDTVVYRKILKDIVAEIDYAEVVATAPNGEIGLRKIEKELPDLVFCDVEMPVMDGLDTLKAIKRKYPKIGVVMVSGVTERQAAITMQALSSGAIDFIPKPNGRGFSENVAALRKDITPIVSLFYTKTLGRLAKTSTAKPAIYKTEPIKTEAEKTIKIEPKKRLRSKIVVSPASFAPIPNFFEILVIGISTGGPNALAAFLPKLPANLRVPVLIVQHMPPMFTKSLANHLNERSNLEILEATDDTSIEAGKVYIAPGGKHMVLTRKEPGGPRTIKITDTPPVNSCKPSVDVLFDSIPSCYNGKILSVVMTGMGSDGARGVINLKKAGCLSITQTEKTCTVYGMPRAVADAGLSDEEIDLPDLANRIVMLLKN